MRMTKGCVVIATLAGLMGAGVSWAQVLSPQPDVVRIENPSPGAGDNFGSAVTLRGDFLAVGASFDDTAGDDVGAVYVFRDGLLEATLLPSDPVVGGRFGSSVASDGWLLVVGAPGAPGSGTTPGAAFVFERVQGQWLETARLVPTFSTPGAAFGQSVAVEGELVVVGAPFDAVSGTASGAVFVFVRNGSIWSESRIDSPTGASGLVFGASVAVEGDHLLAGSPYFGLEFVRGSVYSYDRIGGIWTLGQQIHSGVSVPRDRFGASIAISRGRAAIGATRDPGPPPFGIVDVFDAMGGSPPTNWAYRQTLSNPEAVAGDRFGISVDVSGNRLAVGAAVGSGGGAAYIFHTNGGLDRTLTPAGLNSGDRFGWSVTLTTRSAAVGAPGDDATGVDSGTVWWFPRLIQ